MKQLLRIAAAAAFIAAINLSIPTVHAQNTAITYQGRVMDNGTNFTGTGQFAFALVTSTNGQQATATPTMGGAAGNQFVSSIAVGIGGSGYTTAPAVNISGAATVGATAQANISGGVVISITVLTPGSGYSSAPTITVAPPSPDYITWWSNDGTSVNGSEPSTNVSVSVSQGLFTVILGNTALPNMTAIPAGLFATYPNVQLLIWFNDGVNGPALLTPPQSLTATPYAAYAQSANAAQLTGTLNLSTPVITSGGNILFYSSAGSIGNIFTGPYAGNPANDNGIQNTADGYAALSANRSGGQNTVSGYAALAHNSSGWDNTASGWEVLDNNSSGTANTASGAGALFYNQSGSYNTAIGYSALEYLGEYGGSGTNNIALGLNAGSALIDNESSNIDIGSPGLQGDNNITRIGTPGIQTNAYIAGTVYGDGGGLTNLNISGTQITSIGGYAAGNFYVGPAGNAAESGVQNTGIGNNALENNTTGGFNVASGMGALQENTSGSENTANGVNALLHNQTGSLNVAGGYRALSAGLAESYNTAYGVFALEYVNGTNNTALGYNAGANLTGNESSNIDIGSPGLQGDNNITRIGTPGIQTNAYIAGTIYGDGGGLTNLNISGTQITGYAAGNFYVGSAGNASETGVQNTGIGNNALEHNTTGSYNVASGMGALQENTSGSENTANGVNALLHNQTGSLNVASGYRALSAGLASSDNTAYGVFALEYANGTNNTALGYNAGANLTANESSNIDIGNFGVAGDNNIIRIGIPGIQANTYIAGVINGNGGGLTNLNANNLSSGVVSPNFLPGFQSSSNYSAVAGGQNNVIAFSSSDHTFIGGGWNNTIGANDYEGTIAGGYYNMLLNNAGYSYIGGGEFNTNGSSQGTIGGGENNNNSSSVGTIAGGQGNQATGQYQSTVGGGYQNIASGSYGTVPGGFQNVAGGTSSFAAGSLGQATNTGAFVWSDNSGTVFASTNSNSFNARAAGGYRLYTSGSGVTGAGVYLAANGNSWTSVSDRNAKKNFRAVDYQAVLNKLASVPIQQWNYKWESDQDVPNIGPMAQDFKHAFYPGRDDKGISTLEFDGVELAAIQGLNQKLEEQSAENAALKQELNELKAEVKLLAQREKN